MLRSDPLRLLALPRNTVSFPPCVGPDVNEARRLWGEDLEERVEIVDTEPEETERWRFEIEATSSSSR